MPKLRTKSGLYKLYVFFFMGTIVIGLLSGLALHQIQHAQDEAFDGTVDEYIEVKTARKNLDFGLTGAATGTTYVPRVYVESLPKGLPKIRNVRQKKELFSATMLPLILRSNELILEERNRLLAIKSSLNMGQNLSKTSIEWILYQGKRYGLANSDTISAELIDQLLHHCDIIPPSLALAQAAIESGWGTSRFAQTGNAIFGQWVWGNDADGMLPLNRNEGSTHKVRKFDLLIDSVRSYSHNLNRNNAYEDVRKRRASLRDAGKPISGLYLAHGLTHYSERGEDYIKDVITMISYNQFSGLDHSRLEPTNSKEL